MDEKRPKDDRLEHAPPVARLLGRTVIASDPCGTVELRFTARDEFTNRHGTIQGGILTAMLDSAGGMASLAALERASSIVTVEMKTTFFRPARPGSLRALGRVIHRGKTLMHTEADLLDDDGALIARATATFRIVRTRQP